MPEPFDYGKTLPNGQHERHPSEVQPEYVQPIRHKYIHQRCQTETVMRGHNLAETYATNPGYYTSTFCVGCRDYFPIAEFYWSADHVSLDTVQGEPGKILD